MVFPDHCAASTSAGAGRSHPVDMPAAAAGRKGSRRTRTGSNVSNASESRKIHPSGEDGAGESSVDVTVVMDSKIGMASVDFI